MNYDIHKCIFLISAAAQVRGNGISFFDVTANVTLDSVVVTDTTRDGITVKPLFHDNHVIPSDTLYPTFQLCDTNRNMFIKHGVEYKFFPTRATNFEGCIRRFETEERYVIQLTMRAETTSYYGVLTAEFYEGTDVDIGNRISQFTTYRSDRGAQVSEVERLTRVTAGQR